jgi:endonuclease/exonuclease/phosphatase family metal-dependent hydrolase
MSIKVASWNTELRLTNLARNGRGAPSQIIDRIEELDADILVLPEAYSDTPGDGVDDRLRALSYTWKDTAYGEDGRQYQHGMPHMRILSRLAVVSSQIYEWGDARSMLVITVNLPDSEKKLRVIGVHLDDRSETNRLKQVDDMIPFINSSDMPTIMLGDWNAMHGKGRAKLVGSGAARRLARFVPSSSSHDDLRSFAMRVTDMATGNVMERIESETNLRDLDPRRRATTTPKVRGHEWLPAIRLVQIDHIVASPSVEAEKVQIGKDGGSDHRDISAIITLI